MDIFNYNNESQARWGKHQEAVKTRDRLLEIYTAFLDEHTEFLALGETSKAKSLQTKIKQTKEQLAKDWSSGADRFGVIKAKK